MAGCFSFELLSRILAFVMTFAAAYYMFVDRQTARIGGFVISATYKNSPSFKFFIGGNAIAAVYCLITIIIVHCRLKKYLFFIVLLDFLVACLVIASASAATSIGYVGKFGNDEMGWPKVCGYCEAFCKQAEASIAFSYLGFFFLFVTCACSQATSQ